MNTRLASTRTFLYRLAGVAVLLTSLFQPGTTDARVDSQSSQAGASFVEPPVIYSKNGVLDATLRLRLSKNRIAGRELETGTYAVVTGGGAGIAAGSTIPGPTLRVRPGDVLRITLINDLTFPCDKTPCPGPPPQKVVDCGMQTLRMALHAGAGRSDAPMDPNVFLNTNLHTHGLQVSPIGNADNPYIDLLPGQTCKYSIQIPGVVSPPDPYRPPQPSGLYWYHPHRHVSTSKQSWGGLAGAIIVEGDIDRVPEVAAAKERLLVLQELWVDDKGRVPAGVVLPVAGPSGDQVPFSTNPAVPTNIYYTVNGVYQPAIPMQPGATERWRILNASPHRFYRLNLEGQEYYQIAQDGIPFGEAVRIDEAVNPIVMAPGNRVEIVIRGRSADQLKAQMNYTFKAVQYEQGHPGGALPAVTLATLQYVGAEIVGRKVPTKLIAPAGLSGDRIISSSQQVVFNGEILQAPVQFFINGKQFDPAMDPIVGRAGETVEWTLVNKDVFQHPFHIHVNPFQVVAINGKAVTKPIWWDTFALPPRDLQTGQPSSIRIRMRFRSDVTGKTVFHCHILPHEDNGMMSVFELVPSTR